MVNQMEISCIVKNGKEKEMKFIVMLASRLHHSKHQMICSEFYDKRTGVVFSAFNASDYSELRTRKDYGIINLN